MYRKYYFITSILLLLYAFQIWIKFFSTQSGFIRNYLADLLALPLILVFSLLIVRKIKQLPFFYLNKAMVLFTLIYTSTLFEYILPKYNSRYVSDNIDIVLYAIGALAFYFAQEKLKKDEYSKMI